MGVYKSYYVLLLPCFIAHCDLLSAASSKNKTEVLNRLSSVLKMSRYLDDCNSASDCKEKDEGCFIVYTYGHCLRCEDEKKLQQTDEKYEVKGCETGIGGQTTWIIVGIVIGVLVLAAVVVSLVVCCLVPSCPLAKRRKNQNGQYGQYPQGDGQGQYQYQGQPGQYQGQDGQFQGQGGQYQGPPGQYQGQPGQYQGQLPPPPGYAYGQAPQAQYAPGNMAMPGNNSGRKVSGSGSGSSSGSYSGSSASGESVKVAPGPGTKKPPKTKATTHKTKT